MVWVLLGVGVALILVAAVGLWLLEAGERRLARARAALAEDHARRRRLGL